MSALRLLVPPLRVMSAVMWKVVHLRNVNHYGKVEEFVSLVTEAIPDILTSRQMRLLTLGLRAKVRDSNAHLPGNDVTSLKLGVTACFRLVAPVYTILLQPIYNHLTIWFYLEGMTLNLFDLQMQDPAQVNA